MRSILKTARFAQDDQPTGKSLDAASVYRSPDAESVATRSKRAAHTARVSAGEVAAGDQGIGGKRASVAISTNTRIRIRDALLGAPGKCPYAAEAAHAEWVILWLTNALPLGSLKARKRAPTTRTAPSRVGGMLCEEGP
jgi:hypothetical protein